MKAILTLDNGTKIIADLLNPPKRVFNETQEEYERKIMTHFNASQLRAVHKITKIHLTRN